MHCAHMSVFLFFSQHGVCFCATRRRARDLLRSGHCGPKTIADLMAAIVPRAHALRSSSKVVGGRVPFYGSAHPLIPNGRMCALDSPLPPFPTNPLSQHRNALCAHGCVFVFFFTTQGLFLRKTGARAGPTKVWALWTQDNRGPHGRNRSQALRCVHHPLPVDPTLFWFSRLSLVCLPHLMVPSGWGARGLMAKVSFPSIVSPR